MRPHSRLCRLLRVHRHAFGVGGVGVVHRDGEAAVPSVRQVEPGRLFAVLADDGRPLRRQFVDLHPRGHGEAVGGAHGDGRTGVLGAAVELDREIARIVLAGPAGNPRRILAE